MDLEKVMNDMGLSDEEKSYIRTQDNNKNVIESITHSIWQVIEDASGYG